MQHEKSAASVLCQIKTRYGAHASLLTLRKDVIGIVPMLGRVEDDNLSRYILYERFLFGLQNHTHSFQSCNSLYVSSVLVTLSSSKMKIIYFLLC